VVYDARHEGRFDAWPADAFDSRRLVAAAAEIMGGKAIEECGALDIGNR